MSWWYSQEEDRGYGPCESREEAIEKGRGYFSGEAFMVVEAERGHIKFDVFDAEHFLGRVIDCNEELFDPDDDPLYFITQTQGDTLERLVNMTIREWVSAHAIPTQGWGFSKMGKIEDIPEEKE